MNIRSIRDAEVSGKRVLLRVDFNVPMQGGQITDDSRITAAVPTINYLLEHGAKIKIITHLGRPEGAVVESLRTAPLAKKLSEYVTGDIEMLENLRFSPSEETNDENFAKELASHGDIFVNDAFAVSHRAHASTVGVTKFLPSYAGFLIEKEITNLSRALTPPSGSVAVVGGAKLETKAPLIEKLAAVYDKVFVGGAIANQYKPTSPNVFLPIDGVRDASHVADIGPATINVWSTEIAQASFVLWNGPVGMYEDPRYKEGTNAIAQAIAASHAQSVIGGGDTGAAIAQYSFDGAKVFLSTGGGAMLEFLVQGTLPGIEPLLIK
jgi:phosphoglycerate kinase